MTVPPAHGLLLTAGLGTRLRPLTLIRAKPAMPVAGEPLVRRIVRWLGTNGVTNLVLNLHHLPATIAAVAGDGSDLGVRIRYSWEQPVVLGSAGGPRLALPMLGGDPFVIVNGDTLTDVDLCALAAAHASAGALVTLALVPNREPQRYGGVRLDRRSRVTGFVPRGAAAEGSFHFVGVQLAAVEAFGSLPAGRALNSIGGVYDDWVTARPGSIHGFVSEAAFWDIGTLSDYWRTSLSLLESATGDPSWRGRDVRVDPAARVQRSILWDAVEVGPGAVLEECIVADGVRIPAGTTYRRMALAQTDAGLLAAPVE